METDSWIKSRLTALVGGCGGEEIEQKEKELMNMDNRVVTAGGEGWLEVEEGISGININGKIQ